MEHIQQFYKNKQVLVTGGAGFIGSHLVEALVALGARVTILDNFSSGTLTNVKSVVSAISVMYGDIRSTYSCLKATEHKEIVFHCAASISVPQSIIDPETCYAVNINGTINMLEACKKNGVPAFMFSTSSAVYGNKEGICHEHDTVDPLSPYAISKLKGEEACKKYAADSAMSVGCLRYFNVFGERQNPNGPYAAVVTKFTHQLKHGEPITLYGDGTQTRDFINVTDIVKANLIIGTMQSLKGEVFNIASGTSINLLTLLEQLENSLGIKRTGETHMPPRHGDILHSAASIQKYRSLVAKS